MNDKPTTPCVPATIKQAQRGKQVGDLCSPSGGAYQARQELIKRAGPPPFPGAICRHLCDNDSMANNGFVCVEHTVWGSRTENLLDRSYDNASRGARIVTAQPDHTCRVQVNCPHCGKTGTKLPMMRYHFDRCKHRAPIGFSGLPSVTFGDETNRGHGAEDVAHF